MNVRVLGLVGLLAVLGWGMFASAEEAKQAKKEVTLSGDLACAKCVLKQEGVKACTANLAVKDGAKVVNYTVADNKVLKEFKENWKAKAVKVTATGSVDEKDGTKTLTLTKVAVQSAPKG